MKITYKRTNKVIFRLSMSSLFTTMLNGYGISVYISMWLYQVIKGKQFALKQKLFKFIEERFSYWRPDNFYILIWYCGVILGYCVLPRKWPWLKSLPACVSSVSCPLTPGEAAWPRSCRGKQHLHLCWKKNKHFLKI